MNTCSNRTMDEGNLANDLPDWWPYPVQCGHGHPWSPGHVLVSYVRCPCRAEEGISGHTVVRCTVDGCPSAWYCPQHYPHDVTLSHQAEVPTQDLLREGREASQRGPDGMPRPLRS
jgi:hypothetical protein